MFPNVPKFILKPSLVIIGILLLIISIIILYVINKDFNSERTDEKLSDEIKKYITNHKKVYFLLIPFSISIILFITATLT